jgi:hypothetical protein
VILALYTAVALAYGASVPPWEAVDEAGHFAYAKYLRDHWSLPYQPADPNQLVLSHWFHPPLYYAVAALVTSPIDVSDFERVARPNPHFEWIQGRAPGGWNVFLPSEPAERSRSGALLALRVLRLLSIAMGAAVVASAYRLARLLVPTCTAVAPGAAALTAFNPSFVYMTSGAHNDNLATLLGGLTLLWAVTVVSRPVVPARALALGGGLLGLALLTKTGGLALVPVVAAAAAVNRGAPTRAAAYRRAARGAGLALGVATLVAGWWYVRNVVLYGDPLAWSRYMATHAFIVRPTPLDREAIRLVLAQLGRTYWAAFGYMNLLADERVYPAVWGVAALGLVGLLRGAFVGQLRGAIRARWPSWTIALGAAFLYCAALGRYASQFIGVGHGRLIFPVLPVFSLLLALGLVHAAPRSAGRALLALACVALAALAAACTWLYVAPAYAVPRPVDLAAIQAAPPESQIVFGDGLRLVGWRVTPDQAPPGGSVELTLLWSAQRADAPDLFADVRLRDREGAELFRSERRPLEGRLPTDRWRPGEVYADSYEIPVPPRAYTGLSPLVVGVKNDRGLYLEPRTERWSAPPGPVPFARLPIGRASEAAQGAAPASPVGAAFAGGINLRGFDLPSASVRAGQKLDLTLYWSADAPVAENYTVFLHVADSAGRPVAQADGEPSEGAYPTSVWRPGEVVRDRRVVAVPADAPVGHYRLAVGFYLRRTGERLAVVGGGDVVELGTVAVEPG